VKTIRDPAADFVPACERVFGRPVRVVDAGRAVLVGDEAKLRLDAGERELWVVRVHGLGLEDWVAGVEVKNDIERAVRKAKELLDRA
jgi:hypothetical protein